EFAYADTPELYSLYVSELFRFDQLYRHFCEAADLAESAGWDLLKPLRDDIESVYCNWYLMRLGIEWGKCLNNGLLEAWRIADIPNQQDFYKEHVLPRLKRGDRTRVFVIISDAFRFEAAQELCTCLNGEYRLQADLTTLLGTLPSYTTLGMASLLPGKILSYGKSGDVTVDEKASASLDQRNAILETVNGMAIKAEELISLTQKAGRARVKEKQIVYVYHNVIDAVGDSASTEVGTFSAVRKTINELASLVRFIINNLNGNHMLITADHGFLFSESAPTETDKSKLNIKDEGVINSKKRYVLGEKLGSYENTFHGKTHNTAGTEDNMEFLIPKGVNRFHFVGGARFVHGGSMPQEIVVPVLTVKHIKDKSSRRKTKSKPVSVSVLGATHRITTPHHRFQLLQMEAVSERVKPVTLKAAVYEGDAPVSNIETVTSNSVSDSMSELQKDIHLVLQERQYDKKTTYRLILRDADTGIEQQHVNVIIDRAITDDF
ncbi:MAG: BREX-1 system phosphatase PglZ type A, partial [Candidatus Hydrogenedentes bacterium]|nr:BREX-1 system phosphatase PglZ type A [Candidatus Hydrogenedentota bacterium]